MDREISYPVIDALDYRKVLGQYPTGVSVITGRAADGNPVAMVVGSFTSVSLDPPLVGFFPDLKSTRWSMLRGSTSFCVNILAADQQDVCRALASKDLSAMAAFPFAVSDLGNPIVNDVVARIECDVHAILPAGDHELALGRVLSLENVTDKSPLLFVKGAYGSCA